MNSLNSLGNRQVASLQADLTRMENGEGGAGIHGELRLRLCTDYRPLR
jgi:Golgi SNAP receptor complex protein 2